MVYLHDDWEIRSAVPYAKFSEFYGDSHILGCQGTPWHSAW